MEEINKELKKYRLVLMKFSAPWCGACQMMQPTIEKVKETNSDVHFMEINVDENLDVANHYKIMGLPTIKMFKDEKEVGSYNGAMSVDSLQELISKNR